MPYYKSANILFIHIPKTGGSSLETFLKKTHKQTLYLTRPEIKYNKIPDENFKHISYQHQTYLTLYNYRKLLNINFNNINIITIVRNPYDRIMSDLFYFKLINKDASQDVVFEALRNFINSKYSKYDNHNLQQYKYLVDENDNLIKNITIFRTETLTKDLNNYGFNYQNNIVNKNNITSSNNYMKYLNKKSIDLINLTYEKDFKLFNYSKK